MTTANPNPRDKQQSKVKNVIGYPTRGTRIILAAALFLYTLTFPYPTHATDQGSPFPTSNGAGTALEGDLVSINGNAVKLWGIDAPDLGQMCIDQFGKEYDCALAAKNILSSYIGKKQITCYIRGKNSHGQQIGTCGIDGLDLGALMIRDGYAMSFRSLNRHYDTLQAYAQTRKRGLWKGRFKAPWLWRSEQIVPSRP